MQKVSNRIIKSGDRFFGFWAKAGKHKLISLKDMSVNRVICRYTLWLIHWNKWKVWGLGTQDIKSVEYHKASINKTKGLCEALLPRLGQDPIYDNELWDLCCWKGTIVQMQRINTVFK